MILILLVVALCKVSLIFWNCVLVTKWFWLEIYFNVTSKGKVWYFQLDEPTICLNKEFLDIVAWMNLEEDIGLGNCDIDFLNFCHRQVWNFKILNLYKRNQNFGVIFWTTKYFATSWKPSVIPLKFHEMSLVSWNLINYCKISQFLIKFSKSLIILRKILLKWFGKTVRYCLNFINFHSCTEKWQKVGQLLSMTLSL